MPEDQDPILRAVENAQSLHFGRARPQASTDQGAAPDIADLDLELSRYAMTDLGNAERFYLRYRDKLLFCEQLGWLVWDGRRWNRELAKAFVATAEHDTVRAIQREAKALADSPCDFVVETKRPRNGDPIEIKLSDRLAAWGRASEAGGRLAIISARARPMLQVAPDAFDRDHMRLNVLNGTLAFSRENESGYVELLPHDPSDRITKLAPAVFDPDATCPLFDTFLARVQPDAANRRFLAQWAGLSLTGDTGEHRLTFHYGKGRNGKGVWVSAIKSVLGDYHASIRIESFLDSGRAQAGGQATPDIAKLPGVRCLMTSEPKRGAVLDEGLVKLFTGEDTISARHLNKEFFDFQPCAKLTMQGNYRPKITGTDEGIWNRMILVPWPIFIPKEDRDPNLAQKLRAEASGILNRFLDGLRDWMDHGLLLPESVVQATDEYRADSDPLGRFLEVCTRSSLGSKVQSADMHALFVAWARANGETEWSSKGLSGALKERGLTRKKSTYVHWLDVKLIKRPSDFIDENGKPKSDLPGSSEAGDDEYLLYALYEFIVL